MRPYSVADSAGQSSEAPTRPEGAPDQPPPIPRGERLGYSFDPIPKSIRHSPRLKPLDGDVLAVLLEFRIWRRDSCWSTVGTVAARIQAIRPGRSGSPAASERTVQRSIKRLKDEKILRHERVAKPDPDDPRNLTGWRFYFDFIPVEPPAPESPGEVTKDPGEVTKGPSATPDVAPGATIEAPDSVVTQVRGEVREPERETTTTPRGRAREEDGEPRPSSSSPRATLRGEGEAVASIEPPATADDPARATLIAAIQAAAPGAENRDVRQALFDATPDLLTRARRAGSPRPFDHVRMAIQAAADDPTRRKSIESLARAIVRNWAGEGFPAVDAPEPPGRPKPPPDPESERAAEVERHRARLAAGAEFDARKARWEALPGPEKDAIRAEVDRENPALAEMPALLRERARTLLCRVRLASGPPG